MREVKVLGDWLDLAVSLLERPQATFPVDVVRGALLETLDSEIVGWNWRDEDGRFGIEAVGEVQAKLWDALADFTEDDLLRYPMVQWYAKTQDIRPQSYERIPAGFGDARHRAHFTALLRSCSMPRQLAIPCEIRGGSYRVFLIGRSTDEYTDEELQLAGQIQRLLLTVQRQVSTLALAPRAAPHPDAPALTGRELAVLTLVARGDGTQRIARRLSMSPRTVHKHLEHVYRKLDVADRVSAVMVAMRLGFVPAPGSASEHPTA